MWILAACGGHAAPPPPAAPVAPSAPHAETRPAEPPPPPPSAPVDPASGALRCAMQPTDDLVIDGLIDDWRDVAIAARVGAAPDGQIALRCVWDGKYLAFAASIIDDKIVRVPSGHGHEDHVSFALAAGGKPMRFDVYPGTSIAKPRSTGAPAQIGDSLQPNGFSIEARVPAAAIPGFGGSTPQIDVRVVFHDSDRATGGDDSDLEIAQPLELSDRKDLLDDFLHTVHLAKSDITRDELVDLDPDRKGKERLVAGGTVIGVLTDQFAFVSMPAKPSRIELLPMGPHGQQVIAATVRQTGNGGSRDVLMLWTVWSGQLSPLKNIEIRKELGGNVLSSSYKVDKGKLVVAPQPAVGFTKDTYNEEPTDDAEPILLPWADKPAIYVLKGAELEKKH